ncbi:MAG: FecR domain-containing protein [Thermoleophilia bacterium]|nr:FecR domain-containing protein [Thermoleophilia bacterium]
MRPSYRVRLRGWKIRVTLLRRALMIFALLAAASMLVASLAHPSASAAQEQEGYWRLAETWLDSQDYTREFTGPGSPITWADKDKKLFLSFDTSIRVAVSGTSLEMHYETVDCYDTDEGPYPTRHNHYAKKCEWTPFPEKIVPGETYEITVRAYVADDGGTNAINAKAANFSIQDLLGDASGGSGAGKGVSVTAPTLAKGEQAAGKETVETLEIGLGRPAKDPPGQGVFRARVSSGASPGAWGEILYIYEWVDPFSDNQLPTVSLIWTSTPEGQRTTIESTVRVKARASDPDGDPVTYEWEVDGVSVPTTGDTLLMPQPDKGVHKVVVRVSDGRGGTDQDWVSVEVHDPADYASTTTTSNYPYTAMDSGTRFSDISGNVDVAPGHDPEDYDVAEMGMVLYVNDHIRTGPDSEAILSFTDMTTFHMKPNTIIVLESPPQDDSKIKLVIGNVRANIKKILKDGSMNITMNQAVTSIKGTVLVAEETGTESRLKVIDGTVRLTSLVDGTSQMVGPGEMLVATGQGLGEKVPFDVEAENALWAAQGTEAPSEGIPSWLIGVIVAVAALVLAGAVLAVSLVNHRRRNVRGPLPHMPPSYMPLPSAPAPYVPPSDSRSVASPHPGPVAAPVQAVFCKYCGSSIAAGSAACAGCGRRPEG